MPELCPKFWHPLDFKSGSKIGVNIVRSFSFRICLMICSKKVLINSTFNVQSQIPPSVLCAHCTCKNSRLLPEKIFAGTGESKHNHCLIYCGRFHQLNSLIERRSFQKWSTCSEQSKLVTTKPN